MIDSNINYFNFKKLGKDYLLTNDSGYYIFLSEDEFESFTSDKLQNGTELYHELVQKCFIIDSDREIFINEIASKVRKSKGYLFDGTQLHIFVLTSNCNQHCIYCQASIKDQRQIQLKMDKRTAEKAVDIALQAPNENLMFEFQGGEPLLNFDVLRHIVEYTNERNKQKEKKITYNLVSNLTVLDDVMVKFLVDNGFSISTSIDGPDYVHNLNRPYENKDALKIVKRNIAILNQRFKEKQCNTKVQAILTTTRKSLQYPKQIIDEYIEMGMESIFIRPLTPLGYAEKNWDAIRYEPEEFLEFYKKCIEYIIELSKEERYFTEGHASIFLKKILSNEPVNYMELRSPCGGGIGQLAYYYDGNIYTCDEGRMLAETGDKSFQLGNVYGDSYKSILENPIVKTLCIASCLETIPGCSQCVYNPYCGVCPIINYEQYGSIFAQIPKNYRCKIYKGIQDVLFKKLQSEDMEIMNVFLKWIK